MRSSTFLRYALLCSPWSLRAFAAFVKSLKALSISLGSDVASIKSTFALLGFGTSGLLSGLFLCAFSLGSAVPFITLSSNARSSSSSSLFLFRSKRSSLFCLSHRSSFSFNSSSCFSAASASCRSNFNARFLRVSS